MRKVAAAVVVCLLLPCWALAQSPDATITGRVTDPSKAAIPGAKVIVTNVDTGVQQSGATDSDGLYRIVFLKPGNYKIEVEKQGFRTVVKPDVVLHVQDAPTINFELAVGTVSESITVTGGTPLINTESATVSTVVDRQFAENLPMNGRSFQTLIQLTPGVVLTTNNLNDSGQFSVNGQRAASNYWMVDGVSANIGIGSNSSAVPGNGLAGSLGSFGVQGGTNSLVSVDAMQEFRIQTSTYAPEFGRTPGGQISIVTRSGTNQFHGTAFDYLRNDLLDANDWFANNAGLPKPKERQNDFGGTFSGPILKDRTFFFFSYEGLRLRLPQTALTTVPCDSTCTMFGNARAMAVTQMEPFLNAYPLPNGQEVFTPCTPNVNGCPASGQRPTGAAQFNASFSDQSTLDAYSLRIDHKVNDKFNFFGRYNYSPSDTTHRGGGSFPLNTLNPTRITTQTATLGTSWLISPDMANDLRFNYSRTNVSSLYEMDNFGGAVPLASLPFPSTFTNQSGLFTLGILSLQKGFLRDGKLQRGLQRQINIVDGLSLQKGSHSLKFGVDFRRLSPLNDPFAYFQDTFFANVLSTENANVRFSIVSSSRRATFLFRNLGVYAQDTWRIFPRLTLTYGLRWDVDVAPESLDGPSFPSVTGFNVNDLSRLALQAPGASVFQTKYRNFAPRVAVAYQLRGRQDWQTVIRSGFGVFYDLGTSEIGNLVTAQFYPFGATAFHLSGTFPLSQATAAPPPITAPTSTNGAILFAVDPNLELPYTLEWNVSLEQGLGREQTLSASYVGAAGRRLLQSAFVSSPNANLGSTQLITNAGTSDYHALQIKFNRRLSRRLQALASYTWSHSLDTGSASSDLLVSNLFVPGTSPTTNRGASDFDIRHSFSAGFTYDVPAPKVNRFAEAILGGWSLENIILARSAPPVDVSDANFFEFNGGAFADIRPDLVSGQALYLFGPQYPGGKAFNPAAFTDPPVDPVTFNPIRQGNVPRNFLRGFGAIQWDFAVHRTFPVHESLKLQFRAEMFNILNHPNFGPPSGQFGIGGFGLSAQMLGQSLAGPFGGNVGGGAFSPLYQIGGPRSIQLALKLTF